MLATSGNKKQLTESPTQLQSQRKRTMLHIKMVSGKLLSPTSDQAGIPASPTGHINIEDGGQVISGMPGALPIFDTTTVIEEPAFDEIT